MKQDEERREPEEEGRWPRRDDEGVGGCGVGGWKGKSWVRSGSMAWRRWWNI